MQLRVRTVRSPTSVSSIKRTQQVSLYSSQEHSILRDTNNNIHTHLTFAGDIRVYCPSALLVTAWQRYRRFIDSQIRLECGLRFQLQLSDGGLIDHADNCYRHTDSLSVEVEKHEEADNGKNESPRAEEWSGLDNAIFLQQASCKGTNQPDTVSTALTGVTYKFNRNSTHHTH